MATKRAKQEAHDRKVAMDAGRLMLNRIIDAMALEHCEGRPAKEHAVIKKQVRKDLLTKMRRWMMYGGEIPIPILPSLDLH